MKAYVTLLSLLIVLLSSCSASAGRGGKAKAMITLSDSICNFGTVVYHGGQMSRTVTFTNTGKKKLVIDKVTTSCHCTQPTYGKEPVQPGATGSITVTLNPMELFLGYFERTITVYSNAANSPVNIYVRGTVMKKE